jgi:hypothetical protein
MTAIRNLFTIHLHYFTIQLHHFAFEFVIEIAIHNIFEENKTDMKKNILIFSTAIATFLLTAFAFSTRTNTAKNQEVSSCSQSVLSDNEAVIVSKIQAVPDLYYNVGNRWSVMTKEGLIKAKSLSDLVPGEKNKMRDSYKNVLLAVLHNDKDVRDIKTSAIGQSKILNAAQLALLRSCDYSTNLRITALSQVKDVNTGMFEDDSLVYYMTIIPETEAVFEGGFNALIEYLRESSKDRVAIIEEDKVQPGKVFFTVTKNGTIENIKLVATSGYPSVDKELVRIVTRMPEKWNPALNSEGEKVDQEFVFSFGSMGC